MEIYHFKTGDVLTFPKYLKDMRFVCQDIPGQATRHFVLARLNRRKKVWICFSELIRASRKNHINTSVQETLQYLLYQPRGLRRLAMYLRNREITCEYMQYDYVRTFTKLGDVRNILRRVKYPLLTVKLVK